MSITQEEYAFMEAAAEDTGSQWGTIDGDGRLHLSPFLCLLVYRGVPLAIRDAAVYPDVVEPLNEGEYGSPMFAHMCQDAGVEPYDANHIMTTEGVAGILRLWKPRVPHTPTSATTDVTNG